MRLANARHDRDLLRRLCIAWKDLASSTMEVDDLAAAAALQGGDFLRSWIEAASAPGVDTPVGCLLNRVRSCLVDRLDFVAIVDWFLAEGWTPWDDPKAREVA